jgi:diaminohydroxyphosphoribosylaminopyrimidine deaminase/5-amino-6-(5-phosphoribosylamino)uracil reductase
MSNKKQDASCMRRCLALAEKGLGLVSPNPMVGCVIVRNGKTIAEGYHRRFGGSHAEVITLRKAGKKARGATLYVNLEPCTHFGKTPPCVDAIIASGIKTVVAAVNDPNPFVLGAGVRQLRKAGVRVRIGIMKKEAEILNEKFFTFMKTGLPFVAVKVAQTLDGKIADSRGRSKWITGERSRIEAHRLRSKYDAVLVGASTIRKDNPRLSVRYVRGVNPVRVVVDGRLSIPATAHVANAKTIPTIILTSSLAMKKQPGKVRRLSRQRVIILPVQNSGRLRPANMLKTLGRMGISSVLVEGGSTTVGIFIESGLVQKVYCFVAPKILGGGLSSWVFDRARSLRHSLQIMNPVVKQLGSDVLLEGDVVSQ